MWWNDKKCIPMWVKEVKKEYGIEMDKNRLYFSLGYVQGDYAECHGEVTDFAQFFKAIGVGEDYGLKKRLVLKRIIKDGLSTVNIGDRDFSHNIYVSLNVNFNTSHIDCFDSYITNVYQVIQEIENEVYEAIEDLYYDLNQDLYRHIRNYYEMFVDGCHYRICEIDGWGNKEDGYEYNNSWELCEFDIKKDADIKRAFYRMLKKLGITFERGSVRAVYDGDNYEIIDRKTYRPLFAMMPMW